jgi:iron(III) transport system substrate-binding protein
MKRFSLLTIILVLNSFQTIFAFETEVKIITDRTESHMAPIIEKFEQETGKTVKVLYVESGLLPRLESHPTEADLIVTKTVDILEEARAKNLLAPLASTTFYTELTSEFRDSTNFYFSPSYRARGIFYSKERVTPEELSTYEDLANPKWKGRITIRSGYHDYNISLFCQMAESIGLEKTKDFIKGLKDNLARTPQGNDRAQVQAIYEGKADITIGNSYYMGIMQSSDDQNLWAEATEYFFPNQSGRGSFVLCSGAALTTATRNVYGATDFLQFLIGEFSQNYIANGLYAYPTSKKVALPEINKNLGTGQEGVVDGVFKANFVQPAKYSKHRDDIISYLNEINFDQ